MIVTKNKFEGPFKITGNWSEQSKQLKTQFPQLTEADLKWDTGKDNDLLRRLASRLSKRREEVIKLIRANEVVKS